MKTLERLPHALFPDTLYWYVKYDGITLSVWSTYGSAVEAYLNTFSRQDEIINSFL